MPPSSSQNIDSSAIYDVHMRCVCNNTFSFAIATDRVNIDFHILNTTKTTNNMVYVGDGDGRGDGVDTAPI